MGDLATDGTRIGKKIVKHEEHEEHEEIGERKIGERKMNEVVSPIFLSHIFLSSSFSFLCSLRAFVVPLLD